MGVFNYNRRKTVTVNVGDTPLGSDYPIRVQSMTSTSTLDIKESVEQSERIYKAGGEYVRLTAQGVREAECICEIRSQLRKRGCNVPLVADIHFNPRAAFAAAQVTDKVRINPGNFVDVARTFKELTYTDEEYHQELNKISESLIPFLTLCKEHSTAIRLGVNHGSLSDRIMSRFGDTPAGMVESAMEFLRVCVKEEFNNVAISIKASNTVVMVETVRRLIVAMDNEGMHYPLHLGVTEAGDGEDGRIKSAVGIATLLSEGVGDTIRVSLSEEPELEIPVARKLVDYVSRASDNGKDIDGGYSDDYNPIEPQRRVTHVVDKVGGGQNPIVIASCRPSELKQKLAPDYYFIPDGIIENSVDRFITPYKQYRASDNLSPLFMMTEIAELKDCTSTIKWLYIDADVAVDDIAPLLQADKSIILLVTTANNNFTGTVQAFLHKLANRGITTPAVILNTYYDTDSEWLQVKCGADFGVPLMNGFRDGIWLDAPVYYNVDDIVRYQFGALQAARLRISKTEFISCPGCGRTLFNLQETIRGVKAATSHLTHLKIGIMGCIVNGPGEMADADYGYVGAAAGKISLYKGKQCIEKNIPQEEAIPHLIALIKSHGDWVD